MQYFKDFIENYSTCFFAFFWSSINDATVLGGGGQLFCGNNTKASIIKSVTMGVGGLKNIQICVTSFMEVSLVKSTHASHCKSIEREKSSDGKCEMKCFPLKPNRLREGILVL